MRPNGGKGGFGGGGLSPLLVAAAAAVAGLSIYFGAGDVDPFGVGDVAEHRAALQNEAVVAEAQTEPPFDYYVLALSWSPSYCRDRRDADQCGQGRRFIVHGLWPNFEQGFPSDCPTDRPRLPGDLLRAYGDITPSPGLLAHQWRKHGTCSGLSAEAYFETARRAAAGVIIPAELDRLDADRQVDPDAVERAFLNANPQLLADGVSVKCRDGRLSEVRICLTPDLRPRACSTRVGRDCSAARVALPAPL